MTGGLILPNDITPLTPADAAQVEQNYGVIEQYINQEVITRDGATAMTAPLTLSNTPPSQDRHAATKAYVDALVPVGVIMPFGGTSAPINWMLCNGQSLAIVDYPDLYAVLLTKFGGGTGTFKLPALQGRIPIGMNPGRTEFNTVGKTGGTWEVPVPRHQHTMNHDHGATEATTASVPGKSSTNLGVFERAAWAGSTGNDSAINLNPHLHDVPAFNGNTGFTGTTDAEHLPPYVILNYIIRVV